MNMQEQAAKVPASVMRKPHVKDFLAALRQYGINDINEKQDSKENERLAEAARRMLYRNEYSKANIERATETVRRAIQDAAQTSATNLNFI